jgi:hypothetical protein
MTTTYPRADQLARAITLPIIHDQTTKELYGYNYYVLDVAKAKRELFQLGLYAEEAVEWALHILNERVERLNSAQ